MQSDGARSAFTLSVVHQRKDQRRVTAVALLKAGQRVFLGLDNGVVEEHRCFSSSSTQAVYGGAGGSGPSSVTRAARAVGVLQISTTALDIAAAGRHPQWDVPAVLVPSSWSCAVVVAGRRTMYAA